MKGINIISYMILLSMMLILIISCASTGFLMAKPKVIMYTKPYPPKALDAPIDVYQTNTPTREYIEIAKISCSDTSEKWNMKQILIKAREIGADGIIIAGKVGTATGVVPVGNMLIAADEAYGMVAIAIVFK